MPAGAQDWPTCSWCGARGPGVLPLSAGRRRRVVAAICPDCAAPDDRPHPLGPLLILAFALVAGASLWLWSSPGGPSSRATTALATAWVLLAAGYGVRAVRAGVSSRHHRFASLRSWRWAVPPLLGVLVAVGVLTQLPLRARFAASRAEIDDAATNAADGVTRHGRLGLYGSGTVARTDGVAGVLVDGACGFFRLDPTAADPASRRETSPAATASSTVPLSLRQPVEVGGGWTAGCRPAGT
jgi:hypothetical protein